jgi:SAM-dependent methyltransferase
MSMTFHDPAAVNYQQERLAFWNQLANQNPSKRLGSYYHFRLSQVYQTLIPPGQRVIEFGCGLGDLLASLRPSYGVGVDFSPEMLRRGRQVHPELHFVQADVHALHLSERFDFIIMSDLLNEVWDVQKVFDQASCLASPRSRIIINIYSRLWEVPLNAARQLGLVKPVLQLNWLTVEDILNLGLLADFEPLYHRQEILWPFGTPLISQLCNKFLVKFWPIHHLGLTNFIVLRPKPCPTALPVRPKVSVIVPARNEAGNIGEIFSRTPEMGSSTELVFIEGHSRDETSAEIERLMAQNPQRPSKLLRQSGMGKGDAVRFGFSHAGGEIMMILDADLTVPPEDLLRFYEALCTGKGDFINGVRLVYPMEKQAMRFINFLGNKFFSLAFSWVLEQPIKDTLCGTKAFWKDDYERIAANRAYFGDFDPYGDFDLLFGASRLSLKIVDLPIRYRERKYGASNIHRWKHGWLLLKMVVFAALRLKFT